MPKYATAEALMSRGKPMRVYKRERFVGACWHRSAASKMENRMEIPALEFDKLILDLGQWAFEINEAIITKILL